jgi:predicted metal-dependent peptidase
VYGTLPAGLRMVLDEMDRLPPNLDWRRVLRLFSSSARRTHLQNTLKRPSARFGTIPGVRVRRRHRLLVAIDTSGSIGQDDYDEFFSELTHLYRTGSEIRVVECDVEIQREYDYRGETPRATRGGGGTAFDAPLRYANREYRPDAIIYLTDGFGPAPETRTRAPLLWLISSGGLTRHALAGSAFRGTKVKMRRGSAR